MKKIILVGLCCMMTIFASANAGWFSKMFDKPQSLERVCKSTEIASVCPDSALGDKTLLQCLSENVNSLSKKCAFFVKRATIETKSAGADVAKSLKNKKDTIKENAKATVKDIKDSAQSVKDDAVETGKTLQEIVK